MSGNQRVGLHWLRRSGGWDVRPAEQQSGDQHKGCVVAILLAMTCGLGIWYPVCALALCLIGGGIAFVVLVVRAFRLDQHLRDLGLSPELVSLAGGLPYPLSSDVEDILDQAVIAYVGLYRIASCEMGPEGGTTGRLAVQAAYDCLKRLLSQAATVEVLVGQARRNGLDLLDRTGVALGQATVAASELMVAQDASWARAQVAEATARLHDLAQGYDGASTVSA